MRANAPLICKCGARFTTWDAAHRHFTDAFGTVGEHCLSYAEPQSEEAA